MLIAIEAKIDVGGNIRLIELVEVKKITPGIQKMIRLTCLISIRKWFIVKSFAV